MLVRSGSSMLVGVMDSKIKHNMAGIGFFGTEQFGKRMVI